MSDEKLFSLCKLFGARALEARRKFLGLLPEVNRRDLAERTAGRSWLARRGFSSIFEFAAKLAGVSEEQVRLVLNLERKFEDKPLLQRLLINGEVGVNKLARVASIATVENQGELAERVMVLPKAALDCLVKDERDREGEKDCIAASGLPVHSKVSGIDRDVNLMSALSEGLKARLFELKQKGINLDQLLLEFLDRRDAEIEEKKEKLGRVEEAKGGEGDGRVQSVMAHAVPHIRSRYVSVKIRKVLKDEFGEMCAIPACGKKAENLHHADRFVVGHSHDPRFLAPLCKGHHQLAHLADVRFAAVFRSRILPSPCF